LPDSVSWRVFKNPLSVFHWRRDRRAYGARRTPRAYRCVGTHNFSFESDPPAAQERTRGHGDNLRCSQHSRGHDRSRSANARLGRRHNTVGEVYRANDPELLNWVQGTAAYGFLQAYHVYVQPLSLMERDRFYAEAVPAARLYGATSVPISEAELEMLFHATADRLERSHIVFEFLSIMRSAPILPLLLRPAQHVLVRAAVDLMPHWAQTTLGLDGHGLHAWEAEAVQQAGVFADRLLLASSPAVQACRRMRLPADYLYVPIKTSALRVHRPR
jgi:ER-bound oxygenase mpaB/B'/Rubber oxygenase, catalytic domain